MKYDPELGALAQPWSNNAAGAIAAPSTLWKTVGFSHGHSAWWWQILYEVFDIRGLEEAQQHFENSPY